MSDIAKKAAKRLLCSQHEYRIQAYTKQNITWICDNCSYTTVQSVKDFELKISNYWAQRGYSSVEAARAIRNIAKAGVKYATIPQVSTKESD